MKYNIDPMSKQSFKQYRDGNIKRISLDYAAQLLNCLGYDIVINRVNWNSNIFNYAKIGK